MTRSIEIFTMAILQHDNYHENEVSKQYKNMHHTFVQWMLFHYVDDKCVCIDIRRHLVS